MSETQTHKHNGISGKAPVPVFTSSNDRITITYKERSSLKAVKCNCGKLLCKASVGATIEIYCTDPRCKENIIRKVA